MATQQTASTKIVTGKVRLSYVNIFKKNDKDKYSLAILIPKSDKATIDKIKGAVDVVKTQKAHQPGAVNSSPVLCCLCAMGTQTAT